MLPRLALASLAAAALASAEPGPGRHVQASLVSELESVQPGEPVWIGLLLKMEPGWHTYWKNPGDAGLPTRVTWEVPEGVEAGPIEWPYPVRFGQGPVISYGYEGEVLLPVRLKTAPTLRAGSSVTLKGRVRWLECREACFPGRAEVSLTLPVRSDRPAASGRDASRFEETRQRLPREPGEGWVEAHDGPRGLGLDVRPPREWGPLRAAYFFPEVPETLDHAAPQRLTRDGGAYRLELTRAPNAATPLPRVAGVLVVEPQRGAVRALGVSAEPGRATPAAKPGGPRPPAKEDRR